MQDDIQNNPFLRWSSDRVNAWYAKQDWPLGFNYMPSNAVNFADMWHAETFDPERIKVEMGWARDLGYNAARVNLQYIQWKNDPDGISARFDQFMDIAAQHDVLTVPCLFDDCGFSGAEPDANRQPDPVPNMHNSRALASPGRKAVMDEAQWPDILHYAWTILEAHKDDTRILFWDLYNEPSNDSIFLTDVTEDRFDPKLWDYSFRLCQKVFALARKVDPIHPITSAAWQLKFSKDDENGIGTAFENEIDEFLLEASDIITFHAYCGLPWFEKIVTDLQEHGRPIMCTEWLARPAGSILHEQLPLMHGHKVGAFQWGFVNGRSQTHEPWPNLKAQLQREGKADGRWFHDLLHSNGDPYDPAEIEVLRLLRSMQTKDE